MRMSGTPGNCISGGGAGSDITTSACLPIARSAQAIAIEDPMESPSGRACDEMTKRRRPRMAATIASRSGLVVIVAVGSGAGGGVDLVQELLDAVLSGDRFVVVKLELGRTSQAQRLADAPAQERRGAAERPGRVLPRVRVVGARGVRSGGGDARVVDARELKIRRHLHARERDEPDARVVD